MLQSHNDTHGSARVQAGFRGSVHLEPRLVVNALFSEHLPNEALVVFAVDDLARFVLVPVRQPTSGCNLEQVTVEGWDRCLGIRPDPGPNAEFIPPLVISARAAWHSANGMVELFDRAYVLDGACRLEAAARNGTPKHIPAHVLFELTDAQELAIRSKLIGSNAATEIEEPICRIDTSTPRLEVRDRWVRFTIESDPFVVPTALGYSPAILVRRSGQAQREHVLIGARTIARPLESIRVECRTLIGQTVALRKTGREIQAPYEVRLIIPLPES